MPVPTATPDVELPGEPVEGRRVPWWRRMVGRAARALARGQENAGGGRAPLRRTR
jgi:hypothetical protein